MLSGCCSLLALIGASSSATVLGDHGWQGRAPRALLYAEGTEYLVAIQDDVVLGRGACLELHRVRADAAVLRSERDHGLGEIVQAGRIRAAVVIGAPRLRAAGELQDDRDRDPRDIAR